MSWFTKKLRSTFSDGKKWANAGFTGGLSFLVDNDDVQNVLLGTQAVGALGALGVGLGAGTLGAAGSSAAYGPLASGYATGSSGISLGSLGKLGIGAGLLGANYYQNYKNYELQKEYSEANLDLQRDNFEYQKWLNEHGIGQQLSQYQKAGINLMAASAGAQTSASAQPVEAPQQKNIFGDVFQSLINKNNIDNQIQSQKDIASASNKTSLDIAGIQANTQKDINKSNISADVQKYIFEQGEITKRHMAELVQNDEHFTTEQKFKLINAINSQSMQNQMNKVNYEQKRHQLVQDISKHAYTLFTGKPVELSTFRKSLTDKVMETGIQLKQFSDSAIASLYNGIKSIFYDKKATPDEKRSYIDTQINNFLREYMVDEYQDVSTENLEKLFEALNHGK